LPHLATFSVARISVADLALPAYVGAFFKTILLDTFIN
jgi:hypothetical protein